MRSLLPRGLYGRGLLIVIGLLLSCPSLQGQSPIAGTYRCANISAAGHSSGCGSPPLILRPDGSYQIWAEQGTYAILGKFLVLSGSKKRGPGRLRRNGEIVFEYYDRGRKHTVTFRREAADSPGKLRA